MDTETVIPPGVEAFVAEARALSDADRLTLAEARRRGNDVVRAGSWKAAVELLAPRASAYVEAWARIGTSFVPERLEELVRTGARAHVAEVAELQDVARLVRIAMDEALVAHLLSDTITPPDIRELLHPWQTMLAAAHEARRRPTAS